MSFLNNVLTRKRSESYRLLALILLLSPGVCAQTGPVLAISGFKNLKGKVMVRISDENGKVIDAFVRKIPSKEMHVTIKQTGRLAIEVFHDENGNGRLDTALLGYPTERWGVSNQVRPGFRAPTLEEMLTEVKSDTRLSIQLK